MEGYGAVLSSQKVIEPALRVHNTAPPIGVGFATGFSIFCMTVPFLSRRCVSA